MRRTVAGALAVLAGVTCLTACASDPAPTDVGVAWAPQGGAVLVTWKDTGRPNRITIEGVLSESPSYVKYLPASEPNKWQIPTSEFPPDGNYKIVVETGTSQGGVTSKPAKSPVFDTDGPVRPSAATVAQQGRGVLIKWSVPVAPQDFTPNDPLDVKGTKSQRYVPMVGRPGQLLKAIGPATTSTQQLIKSIKPPYAFQLRTQNEWSARIGGDVLGLTSSISGVVPPKAQFSVPIRARGRVILQQVDCDLDAPCTTRRATPAGVPVVVLTQVTPGSRWTPAARGATTSGGYYDIGVPTAGSRPYKIIVPVNTKANMFTGTSTSRPAYTKSVVRITSAGFAGGDTAVAHGSMVTVSVAVAPALNTTVMLQAWNRQTRRWTDAKALAMRGGRAALAFKAAQPGDFVYRIVVQGAMMFGRPMDGITTPGLQLHVR
ncbi:hypothetical protein GCM10009630_37520 [Kribbella jejuensis]|uniref:Fibronectin type-III domain-containing protein n=1 Tax=Kribbella jejuensis TaxID=236068 RepID=A0A542ESI8_9ACTN|nr:hypothetical protein [Kribbella jejuensis]TQJ18295.1 hypothetical protein FB475_2430 [Kribbella jejuensis]